MQRGGQFAQGSSWYTVSWRIIGYPLLLLVLAGGVVRAQGLVDQVQDRIVSNETSLVVESIYRDNLRRVRESYALIIPKIEVLDASLPGMSTSAIDILTDHFEKQIVIRDIPEAEATIEALDQVVAELLQNQEAIAKEEIVRMDNLIRSHVGEIDLLLGDTTVVPSDTHEQLSNEDTLIMERLSLARGWIEATTQELSRRRVVMDEAQKQILIKKSERRLYMYENGEVVYSMALSLGRRGWDTRSGDFAILDKLGTIWSYWQIWLPNWMGIYFAGSSENGIHGLPYDNAGNVYWTTSIGKEDITYGCIMPNDPDMNKLYNWAEVGVPVTIVN